jgi:3-phenylpropionate/trans-cinnamate dioxygenase ferredoxin reductase subunit
MSGDGRMVIVGGGLAGAKAAETLRDEGFDGEVVLVGDEPDLPYERPPLSKEALRGEKPFESSRVHEPGFYDEHGITVRTGVRAVSLDPTAKALGLDDGSRLEFAALLLATGAAPRRLDVPGSATPGVHYLRTIADSRALHARLRPGQRVVVVGAGWIGCEVAASARTLGADVTVVDPLGVPLERVLGVEVGQALQRLHEERGVRFRLGRGVSRLVGGQRIEAVETSDGEVVAADVVVAAVGVRPRTELAVAAGITVDAHGVVVDQMLRTSAPDVYAAGDVVCQAHPFYGAHLHVEHWAVALNQGPAAALAMLGRGEPYRRLPYFYSDQYDLGLEYLGHAHAWDRLVVRGDLAAREFVGFYVADDRVRAGIAVNVWDTVEPLRSLVELGRAVPDAVLADPDTPLTELATATP